MADRGSVGRHYPAVESPDPAVDQAVAWAIGRVGGHLRVDPAGSTVADEEEDVGGIIEDARHWQRIRDPGILDPVEFLGRVVSLLIGARLDGAGGRLELRPDLPDGWKTLRVRRLRAHRTLLDLDIRDRAEWVTIKVAVMFGPPIPTGIRLPEYELVSRVTVDEIPLGGEQAIFTAAGEHEIVLFRG